METIEIDDPPLLEEQIFKSKEILAKRRKLVT